MLIEYIILTFYLLFALAITIVIPLLSSTLVWQQPYKEKLSSYECGFEPFTNYMPEFEVQYYLVALLFLLFDIELMFLMPWILCFELLPFYAIYSMVIFYVLLVLGFYYEWVTGGLEWT